MLLSENVLRCAVPRRRPQMATYKKEEVKRIFYGDARIVLLILQGHPYPSTRRVLAGVFGAVAYSYPALTKENRFRSARLGTVPPRWLYSWRLEKRSQALQACNLTRNIQADGAPMVHLAPGGKLQGSFFHHRTPELCLGKRTGTVKQDVSFSVRFDLSSGAVAFSSVQAGDQGRPATYRGLSKEVHED